MKIEESTDWDSKAAQWLAEMLLGRVQAGKHQELLA